MKMGGLYSGDLKDTILYKYSKSRISKEKYMKDFKEFHISLNKYRNILREDSDISTSSRISSDVYSFLNTIPGMEEEFSDSLSETIGELLDNAKEHGKSDCLLDIDVRELEKDSKPYLGFDISIVNFSNILLGDSIKNKIILNDSFGAKEKTELMKSAYSNHSKLFSKKYTIDDFANISTFQMYVTGRKQDDFEESGGTGLPSFIKNIMSKCSSNYCYVMSGNKFVFFQNKFMNINFDGTIGFNDSNNFRKDIPFLKLLNQDKGYTWYYFNGTAYNLNFIKEKKGENNG